MKAMKGLIGAVALACAAASAQAETFKIGFMTTLTGPSAALGQHLRDGFLLGIREMHDKLGAFDVEVVIADDELKPDVAVTKIRALIERDRVDILGGIVFSNVMMAVYKPVRDANKIFVSGNAGPSPIAGAQCSENFFSVSWQNDGAHEAMGQYAKNKGFNASSSWRRTIRPGRTRSPASSASTARSRWRRSTHSSTSSTSRPILRASLR